MIDRLRRAAHTVTAAVQGARSAPPTRWDLPVGVSAVLLGGMLVRRYADYHTAQAIGLAMDAQRIRQASARRPERAATVEASDRRDYPTPEDLTPLGVPDPTTTPEFADGADDG